MTKAIHMPHEMDLNLEAPTKAPNYPDVVRAVTCSECIHRHTRAACWRCYRMKHMRRTA